MKAGVLLSHSDYIFPFSAVVGQENLKKALLWNLVNPAIGGVLICGQKGTAKSTIVRGLCSLTENVQLVEIPLNITEDRLIGTIDFQHAVKFGERKFEYGLLKKANGNVLYIDEVNLLSDHIVKSMLDVASSGVNIVEREGVSFSHEAKFILVGSMNPEEGTLRPQFLDRFGLYVDVESEKDVRKRVEIIRRRMEFENNSPDFVATYRNQNTQLAKHILQAKNALHQVTVTENTMQVAAVLSKEAGCVGHRAELILIETAKAIAAWDFRKTININDLKEASRFVLPHRTRQEQDQQQTSAAPPEEDENQLSQEEQDDLDQTKEDSVPMDSTPEQEQLDSMSNPDNQTIGQEPCSPDVEDETDNQEKSSFADNETVDSPSEMFDVAKWLVDSQRRTVRNGSGKRSLVKTSNNQGRYVKSCMSNNKTRDIAFDATIRAAAPYQRFREKNGMALVVTQDDIKEKVREKRTGNTILFVVDASGSMGANKRMQSVKGAILSLLNDAYQKRDKVGLIAFRKQSAELILGITRSIDLAQKELVSLPTGGRTPLEAGLNLACDVIKAARIKDREMIPVIVLVSDGKATYSKNSKDPFQSALKSAARVKSEKIKAIVIDADQSFIKLHLSEKIADAMGADLFEIEDLRAQTLISAVKMSI